MSKLTKVIANPGFVQRRCFASASPSTTGGKTIGQLLNEKTAEYEHKDVFRHVDKKYRWTYVELKKHVDALGNGFVDARFSNKTLGFSFRNEAETVVSFLAAAKSGATPAFTGDHIPGDKIESFLNQAKSHAFFFNPKVTDVWDVYKIFPELQRSLKNTEILPKFPYLKYVVHTDAHHLNGMVIYRDLIQYNRRPDVINQQTIDPQQFVSAVVDGDKVVAGNHTTVLSLAEQLGQQLQLNTSDRVCVSISLSSVTGQAAGIVAPVNFGSMIIVSGDKFNAEDTVKTIVAEKCTSLIATPEQFQAIVEYAKTKNITSPSLTKALIVGAASSVEQAKRDLNLSSVVTFNPQDATRNFTKVK